MGKEFIPYHLRPNYKWTVSALMVAGTFAYAMDQTIVSIAIPQLMASFSANLEKIQWITTAYMLGMAVLMPSTGWLGERLGHRTLFVGSVLLFTLASVLCGLAWSANSMIVFRALQGAGGGAMMPIAMVIFFEIFPPEQRGLAMGIFAFSSVLGPAFGPVIGGFFIEELSWRLIFYINIPLGIISAVGTWIVLKETPRKKGGKFDALGLATMTAFLTSLLIALTKGQEKGWHSDYILTLLLIFVISLSLFFFVERRHKNPFVDIRVFKHSLFTMASALSFIVGVGYYGTYFIVPVFLQNILGYTAIQAGLIQLPGVLMFGFFLFVSGALGNRVSARLLVVVGLAIVSSGLYWLSHINLQTSTAMINFMLMVRGVGLGLALTPLLTSALGTLPPQQMSMGSGVFNIIRYLGGAFGIASMGTVIERRELTYLARYSEHQLPDSFGTGTFLTAVKGLFLYLGDPTLLAQQKSLALLSAMMNREALLSAFSDVYLMVGLLIMVTVIPAFFLRGGAKRA